MGWREWLTYLSRVAGVDVLLLPFVDECALEIGEPICIGQSTGLLSRTNTILRRLHCITSLYI